MKSFDETNWKWDFPKWKSDFWNIENQTVANAVLKNDWKSPKNDWKGWFWASIFQGFQYSGEDVASFFNSEPLPQGSAPFVYGRGGYFHDEGDFVRAESALQQAQVLHVLF